MKGKEISRKGPEEICKVDRWGLDFYMWDYVIYRKTDTD